MSQDYSLTCPKDFKSMNLIMPGNQLYQGKSVLFFPFVKIEDATRIIINHLPSCKDLLFFLRVNDLGVLMTLKFQDHQFFHIFINLSKMPETEIISIQIKAEQWDPIGYWQDVRDSIQREYFEQILNICDELVGL